MPIILVTGFAPFGGESVNPSWQSARRLEGWTCGGHVVTAREIPCSFGASIAVLEAAVDELRPMAVLGVGQAGGRPDLSVERVAVNLDDADAPDNDGVQPVDAPAIEGAPAAYLASLPVKAIVARLRQEGLPASLSRSAGGFVCNHVFFGACHLREHRHKAMKVGFIHVPYLPEQGAGHPGAPTMTVQTIVAGLKIAIETTVGAADGVAS
ncbi:MAG TPA: pyroglutamyl-peptidase I [Roseiarcus sp.]|nr:pyroglutamyl-peptidase I [Roseiarcus sp.]